MNIGLWIVAVLVLLAAIVAAWVYRRRPPGEQTAEVAEKVPLPVETGRQEFTEREVLARVHAMAFDDGGAGADDTGPSGADHAGVIQLVDAALTGSRADTRHAPRRPLLLPRLLQAVNDEDASLGDIGAIIARDPALTGNLLRIANSALYRAWPQPIESIDRAMLLIGIDGVRHLIATAILQPVLGSGRGVFDRAAAITWHHALLAATAAAMGARQLGRDDAFRAQLLGLVHGLAAIMVLRTARDAYAQHAPLPPSATVIDALLERWTAPTARRLARDWDLSNELASALGGQRTDVALDALGPLARSLRVGRVAGAAALLHGRGVIDREAALALLQRMGLRQELAAQVWERLATAVTESFAV